MHSSARALALSWLAVLLVLAPFAEIFAQSASPAAGPSQSQVRTEVDQYVKFLAALSRGRVAGEKASLVLTSKPDMANRKVTLIPEDLELIKKSRQDLDQQVAYSLLPPERKQALAGAFDALLVPLDATPGVENPKVVAYDADQRYIRLVGALADELDSLKKVLDERQKAAGLSIPIPSLEKPKPSAVASPPPGGPGPAPAPVGSDADGPDQPAEPGGDAASLPCSDVRARVDALREQTQRLAKPVDALIAAGERALKNRYFAISRDALEKSAERLAEVEREWRDIADSLKPPAYSSRDLLEPRCIEVLTIALTNAIALNDTLQRLYPKLGEAYSELGQHEQAAKEIAKSVEINPENAKTWSALGHAYLRADQPDESIKAFLRSVELDTYVPDVWLGLAKAYARKSENQLAIHYIRRAISKGYVKFEKLAADPDFATLQGITEFDDLVYLVPGAQPFPR